MKFLVKRFIQFLLISKAKSKLSLLLNTSDISTNNVLSSIHSTCSNYLSKGDKGHLIIENRRSHLLKDKTLIDVIDFGAGSSTSRRSEEDMFNGVKCSSSISKIASASKSKFWCMLLYNLVDKIKPTQILELGTCFGISGSYIAAACHGKYNFITLEGSPEIARIAKDTFKICGYNNVQIEIGPFHKTFSECLNHLHNIDFLFNDGHHDENAVLQNFLISLPYFNENAIMVCDDINWSSGMKNAWNSILQHPKIVSSYDLHTLGIVVISKNDHLKKKNYKFKIL